MHQHTNKLILLLILFSCFGCKKKSIKLSNVSKIETGVASRINKVGFIGDICIMAGGEQFSTTEVFVSRDGGINFNRNSYPEAGKAIYGMGVAKDGTVYLCGFDGKLLISDSSKNTFNFKQINLYKFYNGVAFGRNKKAVFITTTAQSSGNVIQLDSNQNIIDTAYFRFGLNDIKMPTEDIGYIAGFGAILKTTDGGNNWENQPVKNDNFQSLFCLNENEIWTVGYKGSIWHTNNGGHDWNKLRNGNNIVNKQYYLLDIYFKDNNSGWACGEKGLLLYSTDGGSSWTEYEKFTDDALRDMALAPNGDLIVVGDNGGAYRIKF